MSAEARARALRRQEVGVVLLRPIDRPLRRIGGVFVDFGQPHVRVTRLALALEDVDQQRGDERSGRGYHQDRADQHYAGNAPLVCPHRVLPSPVVAPCPTERWQCTHWTSPLPCSVRATCSCTRLPWQFRQLSWRMRLLFAVIMIGSWKSWNVKAFEWWKPFSALARYLPMKPCGRWQATQVATPWWLAFCQESYWGCMMWQFTHTLGSSLMYESPSA